jgi:gliding motility-associated-like protein
MKLTAFLSLVCVLLLCLSLPLQSQTKRVIINTPYALYEMTGAGGTCTYTPLPEACSFFNENIYSTALYKQTLYILTMANNNVYSVQLGVPGSCRLVTSFPIDQPGNRFSTVNALTVDKSGKLYAADIASGNLYRYDPGTDEMLTLGAMPARPGGDLVFYGDKLLMAAHGFLLEVNIADPAASTVYMSTGNHTFWGMISFPHDCQKNKVYGFAPDNTGAATNLVALDLETKTVGAVVCSMPLQVFDAASIVETGNTLGIWVDSILIEAPCTATELTGNATVIGYSATAGDLVYTLSNSMQNTSGRFENLAKGTYQVKITNPLGCSKDTSFTIKQGMAGATFTSTDPLTCELPNGSIFMTAFSGYAPVMVRVNNDPPQTNLQLTGLGSGVYNLSIFDQGSCRSDTTIVLKYERRPDFLGEITTQPTTCEGKTGSINVGINGNPAVITASLNGGPYKPISELKNLNSGYYRLTITNTLNCFYDTLLRIGKLVDPPPQVNFEITDQYCGNNNGKVVVHATGVGSPFEYNISNYNYVPTNTFDQLVPGYYRIGVRNSNHCLWDSVAEIKPYVGAPFDFTIHTKEPTCRDTSGGELRINITGGEAPYTFLVNNQSYASGETVMLPSGRYPVYIKNNGDCTVKSMEVDLVLKYEPECDRVSMPNAFSPNNDGNNDLFRPIHSPYVKQVSMTIYNRYGQVVFRSSPLQPAWNGKHNGRQADLGSYAWVLTYVDFNGKPQKMNGLVLVIR